MQVYVVFSERVYGGMPATERRLVQYMQNAGVHIVFNNELADSNGSCLDEAARELGPRPSRPLPSTRPHAQDAEDLAGDSALY